MDSVLNFAHVLLAKYINSDDISVDMTLGNGKDTIFLASISKFVYGFDIQNEALNNTNKLLKASLYNNYKLFLDSHSNIDKYISEKVKGFIFNFGYLPKGNHKITTKAKTSLIALKKALKLLANNGIIVMVIYTGHFNGKIESFVLNRYLKKLNQKEYEVLRYGFVNQINNPPYLIAIRKI